MNRAILFDMGGTLDGDGLHWLDRFGALYAEAGVRLPRETLRAAFDTAERLAATDETMASARLDEMLDRHVAWQFGALGTGPYAALVNEPLRRRIVSEFAAIVRRAAAVNVQILAQLRARGFLLGVVSNGCGNVEVLCGDLGYAPFLSLVVDSQRVGLFKPDPAIYLHAASRLALPPSSILMVGDSFDRDVRPAKSIGMRTAWLRGPVAGPSPDGTSADFVLQALNELPAALDARERTVA